jgi:hypothetical protein
MILEGARRGGLQIVVPHHGVDWIFSEEWKIQDDEEVKRSESK